MSLSRSVDAPRLGPGLLLLLEHWQGRWVEAACPPSPSLPSEPHRLHPCPGSAPPV